MYFEQITKETLYIALEIVNSNPEYNRLDNGRDIKNRLDLEEELLNPDTVSLFIKLDDTYIGIIDYLMENPNDHYPWLGLLMIHKDYQGYGFGAQAYALYESDMLTRGVGQVRLGVIRGNHKAIHFWESLGFHFVKSVIKENDMEIFIYQKPI